MQDQWKQLGYHIMKYPQENMKQSKPMQQRCVDATDFCFLPRRHSPKMRVLRCDVKETWNNVDLDSEFEGFAGDQKRK